ncbi:MAG: hypothetical protein IPH51_22700 [Rubrivivax sp.]|nr:hypothetical protein [Rubrivivax sp.]
MAAKITERVQVEFGPKLWLLNPAAYNLPKTASGGDYMAFGRTLLAGVDGAGTDFDVAYFVGPGDVWKFFGLGDVDRLGSIEAWLKAQAANDPGYKAIYDDQVVRQKFIRYYGLRGSTIFSKGARRVEHRPLAEFEAPNRRRHRRVLRRATGRAW